MKAPKVFISYSWSSEDHESWVVELAEQLMQSGVETVLDKWDLQPGHNAFKFMEQMVNDTSIDKVLIICDQAYATKADAQTNSGVGTEAQIISPAIYSNNKQDKFVALVTQRDDSGRPYLPTYYSSRMYIDFSNSSQNSESFEKLIRFIFGQPLYQRPSLGKPPTYISDENVVSLGTTVAFYRAHNALKDGKNYAEGAVEEYFSIFIENLSRFIITYTDSTEEEKASKSYDSIASLLTYRNEVVHLFSAIVQYAPTSAMTKRIHSFFEALIRYIFPANNVRCTDWDCDNFKFFMREIYLYMVALFIKQERYNELNEILSSYYFIKAEVHNYRRTLCDHSIFSWHLHSLEFRNKSLKLGKTSLTATLLKERSGTDGIAFDDLMQADFLLYLRARINLDDGLDSTLTYWWPDTAVYVSHHAEAFEVFLRAASAEYYEKLKPIFNGWHKSRLIELVNRLVTNENLPKFGWDVLQIRSLMAVEKIGSRF
ncbi:toll/interleukin-1 receptor domain-containing protein [Pseudomonas congelans]|uniref:toll/interleukin-1 receptor domain-containing protein n=1 Tax=Pseudomonas congelans TaxID=200452 RepID=UPI001654CADA|nr:toll/interleukin-1 receptor domain-containing protein [Pseudomonas congelans]MBC8801195.1 toll/interleukin-1 receptor domain-containing protein [Pseudomonas congelans]